MSGERIRVLLVEDDEDDYVVVRDLLEEIPGEKRMDLQWVSTYAEALQTLEGHEYDVCLFDYHLGAHTGLELLDECIARGYRAPVILLTGHSGRDVDLTAVRAGAADYLMKGEIDADRLERAIRHSIDRSRILGDLHTAQSFLRSVLDALTAHIAILGASGVVVADNAVWRTFAKRHGNGLLGCTTGTNYFEVCDLAAPCDPPAVQAITDGIRRVVEGHERQAYCEYASMLGSERRWYIARVTRFEAEDAVRAVLAYEDITERKLAELELEKSREALRELAIRDGLTGLYNRREMDQLLRAEAARARRHDQPFAFLMLDIDHFKQVNDTHGHQAGDDILRWVSRTLLDTLRPMDIVARYGGEEIAVILPQTTAWEVRDVAERLRTAIASVPFECAGARGALVSIPITVSIGAACFPADGDTEVALVAAADKALYEAKRAGRNRTVFCS